MQDSTAIPHRLHNLTYPRLRINDHALDENLPAFKYGPKPAHLPPSADAGDLDALPVELLHEVMSQLDLRSLLDLRCVNRRATELADSHTQFKAIVRHAHNALRGILAIETGRQITRGTLYEKLCTHGCEQCRDFGGYLYLLSCKRVCFLCLTRKPRYQPLMRRHAIRKFGLDPTTAKELLRMKAIAGIYSPNEKKLRAGVLVDYAAAMHASIAHHGSVAAMLEFVSDVEIPEAAGLSRDGDDGSGATWRCGATACDSGSPRWTFWEPSSICGHHSCAVAEPNFTEGRLGLSLHCV